jgi:hypothetical protein
MAAPVLAITGGGTAYLGHVVLAAEGAAFQPSLPLTLIHTSA